jgi:hypothetical protein
VTEFLNKIPVPDKSERRLRLQSTSGVDPLRFPPIGGLVDDQVFAIFPLFLLAALLLFFALLATITHKLLLS